MPTGAQFNIDGLFYKIGRNYYAYYHNGLEWLKSHRSNKDLAKYKGTNKDLSTRGAIS